MENDCGGGWDDKECDLGYDDECCDEWNDGFINVMMSEACLCGLVYHQLQLLPDGRRQCRTFLTHLKDQGGLGRCIVGGLDLF